MDEKNNISVLGIAKKFFGECKGLVTDSKVFPPLDVVLLSSPNIFFYDGKHVFSAECPSYSFYSFLNIKGKNHAALFTYIGAAFTILDWKITYKFFEATESYDVGMIISKILFKG